MFRPLISHPKFQQTLNAALAVLVGLGLLYLIPKVLTLNHGPHDYFDFHPMWMAGKAWLAGHNPYATEVLPNQSNVTLYPEISIWFYPPYWYPLITPFSLVPFPVALTLWKILNFGLLFAGAYLFARAISDLTRRSFLMLFLFGLAFTCFMYATAVTAWSGQTSFLVYFGMSVFFFGLLKERAYILILGLVLLALKPQIGILAFAVVAGINRYRWTIFPAGAICIFATFPIAITADYGSSIAGFIANLSHHSEHAANTPPHLTGLSHLLYYIVPIHNASLLTLILFFLATIGTAGFVFTSALNENSATIGKPAKTLHILGLFVGFSLFVVPLHYYDMIILAVFPMLLLTIPFRSRSPIVFGLFLCYRPDLILRTIGLLPEETLVSHLVSAGLLLIVIGTLNSTRASNQQSIRTVPGL